MDNPLRDWVPEPLTADSAFVIHLGANAVEDRSGLQGRVEHVRSGNSRRFVSTIDNIYDASATIDLARCPGDPSPSTQWEIFFPPILGGALYTSPGITGSSGPVLTIRPNSLPSLATSSEPFWRVRLTVTSNVTGQTRQSWFRFEYETTCTNFAGCAT